MDRNTLIKTINEEAVIAHIIDEPMDESEMEAEGISRVIEIFTGDDIRDAFDRFVKGKNPDEKYDPARGVFIVRSRGDRERKALGGSIKRACNDDGWLKGRLRLSPDNSDGVKGLLLTPDGEDIEGTFEPEEIPDNDPDFSMLERALRAALAGLRYEKRIPETVSGLDAGFPYLASDPYTVTVYKVGSANTISITKGGRCILFDCGAGSIDEGTKRRILSEVRPDIIIISHWHLDHYNLLANRDFDDTALRMIVITTQLSNVANMFVRAVFRLADLNRRGVILLPLDSVGSFSSDFLKNYGFTNIDLFLGINTTPPVASSPYGNIDYPRETDDTGIIVSIRACNSDSCAILGGDCSYYSWPFKPYNLRKSLAKTSHMVIPHHGGNVLTTTATYTNPAHADIYVSTSRPDFVDIAGVPNAATVTAHKTFIDTIFPNHSEHLTSHLPGDGISFTI